MKIKGSVKRAGKRPNFWGIYDSKVPESIKEIIYHQYYSLETLYVYCDCSIQVEKDLLSIASSYVQNGSVIVESSIIPSPDDSKGKNIYGELHAVISSLSNFDSHLKKSIKNIVIYSDLNNISEILTYQSNFKKSSILSNTQAELVQLFKERQMENPNLNISIEYLPKNLKANNPFAKSAHNAARKILQEQT